MEEEMTQETIEPFKIGDYSLFKSHQEQKLAEDKAMLKHLNNTVLQPWTENQKDWVLRNLNFRLEKEFKLTENSILSIKEWEESKCHTNYQLAEPLKTLGYEEWLANNPKYIKEGA